MDPCRDLSPVYLLVLFYFFLSIIMYVSDKTHWLHLFILVLFLSVLCSDVLCCIYCAVLHYHRVSCSPVWPRASHSLDSESQVFL